MGSLSHIPLKGEKSLSYFCVPQPAQAYLFPCKVKLVVLELFLYCFMSSSGQNELIGAMENPNPLSWSPLFMAENQDTGSAVVMKTGRAGSESASLSHAVQPQANVLTSAGHTCPHLQLERTVPTLRACCEDK